MPASKAASSMPTAPPIGTQTTTTVVGSSTAHQHIQIDSLPDNRKIVTRTQDNTSKYGMPNFLLVGSGTRGKAMYSSIDLIEAIIPLSKGAQSAFLELKRSYDKTTGLSVFEPKTKSDKVTFYRAFNELKQANLVVRTTPKVYLIHPFGLIHSDGSLRDSLVELWIRYGGKL